MAGPPPPGIYVPVPTFFARAKKANQANQANHDPIVPPVDISTQASHAIYLAKSGVRGLVIFGSTGEAVHVHPRDRKPVLQGVRQALDRQGFHQVPIIAGTAAQSIEETVEQLVAAQEAGSRWGLVLAPGFNAAATAQEGLVRWFSIVADRSPIPILIYHFPGVTNMVKLSPASFAQLAAHANIVGCKLSHGDVSQLTQIALNPAIEAEHFHVFTGFGQQLLPVMSVGCVGAIDASAGFFPKSMVRLFQLAMKPQPSDWEIQERRMLQYKVSSVEEIVVTHGVVGVKEAICRLRGFGDEDGSRLPLGGPITGAAGWAEWEGVMKALEEVETAL